MSNDTVKIIENGEEISVHSHTAEQLDSDLFIYFCDECGVYHIENDQTLDSVLAQKHEYDKNKAAQICIIIGEILHLNIENKAMENFIRGTLFSIYPENDPEHWIHTVAELAKKQFPEWETRIDKALNGQTLNN